MDRLESSASTRMLGLIKETAAKSRKMDDISKFSKMSVMTNSTRLTESSGTPSRSARYLYLSSVLGRANTVLRPHPRNMVESLRQLAEEAVCSLRVEKALIKHVDEIEKLITSSKKAGAMMNKSMMHWRMLLKQKKVDDSEVVWMIEDVNNKMNRIKFQLNMAEDNSLANQYLTSRLFQCYINDGLRIVIYDSNKSLQHYILAAKKMRKTLRKLQKKVNNSEYFDNVKDWVMDSVVKCYITMVIDTVSALKLQPIINELVKNIKDGDTIETQFVNRLRCFNVSLHRVFLEAKQRRCHTLNPMEEILAKMAHLNSIVRYQGTFDRSEQIQNFTLLDQIMVESPNSFKKVSFCKPVVLESKNKNTFPPDLFPSFV